MGRGICFHKGLRADMRIYLRCGDTGMSEQFLNRTHIRSSLYQMCGKGMPQGVRMQMLGQVGTFAGQSNDLPR